ncbi:PREDICTED: PRKC apoptosis WT1 regulator protein [Nanorana parkeri]|uniref:PRKC apoptosis WT1 regulator protein n=1 Tax=Nanorana parkeri TaxID=125878 RepID=UPI0008540065|nr:PREDICTED: PRKC apoptosis WT1 regulator protein [Nanorana parkeri]XP_018427208.1 PREDICTED: PRKC apoptosis WT1 regulator protein [Nanorana parkeri]XP_018427209.1 PREDICTED: PRKC apoptosis WT1 regulator protein [Nanorana parkeri]
MASGGFRSHNPPSSNTTDFLEEWKAKREKMRAKMHAAEMAAAGIAGATDNANKTSTEMNNNSSSNNVPNSNSQASASVIKVPAISRTVEEQQVTSVTAQQKKTSVPLQDGVPGGTTQEEPAPPVSQESSSKAKDKGKSCGPSARKGKGQIEKRKMREKRRSTGVVNMASAESPDDYDDDEAGQKEHKKEDTVTQQNTVQNESFSIDPSEWQTESVRNAPNKYKSTNNAPDDDSLNHYPRTDRATCGHHNRDPNSVNSGQGTIEKKIEELEKELVKERQENVRLVKLMQDKEELMMKMKEEIDLLNRDLDDIEDENKQLKQENKTLLKVVGQLTR